MKGCIAAVILLAVVVVGLGCNAAYVQRSGRALVAGLQALPDELSSLPDGTARDGETSADVEMAVKRLRETYEHHMKVLCLSVPPEKLNKIRHALISLECSARAAESNEFVTARRLLLTLAEELADSERLTLRNVF